MRVPRWIVCGALVAVAGCGEPAAIEAPPRAPQGGPQLLLAGDQRLWIVDAARRSVREVRLAELTPGDPPVRIVRRANRFVLWGYATYVYEPERQVLSSLVRDSWFFLPSAREDRVWTAFVDSASPPTKRALRAVREVTIGGEVTVPDARPPGGRWPLAAARSGLVVPMAGDRGVELWDPRADRVLAHVAIDNLTTVGPTDGDRLVACARRCRALELVDLRNGRRRQIDAPPRMAFETAQAKFSPSGNRLAVPARVVGRPRSALRLTLVDPARQRVAVIARSRVPRGYTFVAWSSSGRHVFLSGGALYRRAITWYRVGDSSAQSLPVTVGAFFDMAAT